MAITKQSEEQLLDALLAVIAADTDTGGLKASGSPAAIQVAYGVNENRKTVGRPSIAIDIQPDPDDPMAGGLDEELIVNFIIRTDRDKGEATIDAVKLRLIHVFEGVPFSPGTGGWKFSMLQRRRKGRPGTDGKELSWIETFGVTAMAETA